jgi:hypothetical protein
MRLRRSWTFLLFGGLLVMAVGSAPPSGAAPCEKADHLGVAIAGSPSFVDLSQTNHSLTVTVTALNTCGAADSSYKGPATLRASGTSANGAFVSSGAAGISNISLKFRQGIASVTVTPNSDALGVRLTASDDDPASGVAAGNSALFNVYDETDPCGSTDCGGELGTVAGTSVTVDIPNDGLSGFLGLSLSPHTLSSDCTNTSGAQAMGALYTIAPPSGLPASANYSATVEYTKKVAPGTGVSNFVHCMATPTEVDGRVQLAYTRIAPCDNKAPVAKCILQQKRTGAGDLVVTFWLGGPSDPVGGGFS